MSVDLKCTSGRIIVSIDINYKNNFSFDDGTTLRLDRDRNNFDRKYTQPVNAIVVDSEYIPKGAELLCHHNCTHETYHITDITTTNGEDIASDIKYYSLPENQCYAYRIGNGEWLPLKGFCFSLRIYKPYTGILSNILPTPIKQKLFITTGEFKNKVAMVKIASDYQITYQDLNGKENSIIRTRHYENESNEREQIIAIDNRATEKVLSGEYLIGLSQTKNYRHE